MSEISVKNIIGLISALLMSLVLSGCFSSDPSSFWRSPSAIKNSLKSLEGQSIDAAINRMGLPNAQQKILGRDILVWSDEGTVSSLQAEPLISPLDGSVNWHAVQNTRTHYCVVKAVVSPNQKITLIEIKASSVFYCPGNKKS